MPRYSSAWTFPPSFADLVQRQHGVVSRPQLWALGTTPATVASHVRAGRWRLVAGRVVVLHRGPLSWEQRCWVAVLAAGAHAALCAWTAARFDGLKGYGDDRIHVVVPRGVLVPRLPDVVVHESRRFGPGDVHPARLPPRTTTARSVVDAAAWSDTAARACAIVAAAVQQRLVTVPQLRDALVTAGRVNHRRALAAALDDVEGGAHSLLEIDLVRLCRRASLPAPEQQAVRRDGSGRRRYLDAYWPRERVCVEVDGAFHAEVDAWRQDLDRQNDLAADDVVVLRFSSSVVRLRPERVVDQLRRTLAARSHHRAVAATPPPNAQP